MNLAATVPKRLLYDRMAKNPQIKLRVMTILASRDTNNRTRSTLILSIHTLICFKLMLTISNVYTVLLSSSCGYIVSKQSP